MISRFLFFLGITLFTTISLQAQTGYWEGFITQGDKRHAMNVQLKKVGKKTIVGTATIRLDSVVLALELYGEIHLDRSINLWDTALEDAALPKDLQLFKRRYQLLYRRSIEGDSLKGYWQEVYDPSKVLHKQGRLELKEGKKPKA